MNKEKCTKPLLLTFAAERSCDYEQALFHYDYRRDMNVLNENPAIPFIEAGNLAMLMTITKTEREMDSDDERSYAELYTKTDKARETDDEENEMLMESYTLNIQHFQELISKTFADRERDDEDEDDIMMLRPTIEKNYLPQEYLA